MAEEEDKKTTTEETPAAAPEVEADKENKKVEEKPKKKGSFFGKKDKKQDKETAPPAKEAEEKMAAAAADTETAPAPEEKKPEETADDTTKEEKEDAAAPAGEDTVRKAKGFKRIRGLLSGKSKKNKKADKKADEKPAAEAEKKDEAAAATPAPAATTEGGETADDGSTVYAVDVDERSIATKTKETTDKKPYMLKVVLLLMDPGTRRFELLQLEFDSLKALVSDVLKQIPVSVTEDVLRKQEYIGICGKDGKLMESDKLLSGFCTGNDVLVAIPKDMPAKECARLARPILSDEKVVSMLLSSGIDATAWRSDKDKKKPKGGKGVKSRGGADDSKSGMGGFGTMVIGMIILSILVQVGHIYLSAAIKPGHAVQPGVLLRKCGVLSFLPIKKLGLCEDAKMVFGDNGKVSVFDAEEDLLWEMEGSSCPEGASNSCTAEMRFNDDLTISVGGKTIKNVKTFKGSDISPWPFAESPEIRVIRK